MSADGNSWLVVIDSAAYGPALGVLNLRSLKVSFIGDIYSGLSEKDMAEMRSISFTARDGLSLGGYLALPHSYNGKSLPLVVVPHDGPLSRDTLGYDWFWQSLASRGYAVMTVNYRGSKGVNPKLQGAGEGEAGEKALNDLYDGVKYATTLGVADPKRVCFAGWGYGGYMAALAATMPESELRCAIAIGGFFNLPVFRLWRQNRAGGRDTITDKLWLRRFGPSESLARLSPFMRASETKAPLLLIHSPNDLSSPLEQSTSYAAALRKNGKSVELVEIEEGEHEPLLEKSRLTVLQSSLDFLARFNPP